MEATRSIDLLIDKSTKLTVKFVVACDILDQCGCENEAVWRVYARGEKRRREKQTRQRDTITQDK